MCAHNTNVSIEIGPRKIRFVSLDYEIIDVHFHSIRGRNTVEILLASSAIFSYSSSNLHTRQLFTVKINPFFSHCIKILQTFRCYRYFYIIWFLHFFFFFVFRVNELVYPHTDNHEESSRQQVIKPDTNWNNTNWKRRVFVYQFRSESRLIYRQEEYFNNFNNRKRENESKNRRKNRTRSKLGAKLIEMEKCFAKSGEFSVNYVWRIQQINYKRLATNRFQPYLSTYSLPFIDPPVRANGILIWRRLRSEAR